MRKSILHNWWLSGGNSFDPLSLSPYLWIDAISGDYVSGVDNTNKIVASATAETAQALSVGGTRAVWNNGEGYYIETSGSVLTGSVSDYNFLHIPSSDFELFWTGVIHTGAGGGTTRTLMQNNGFSNSARGFLMYWETTGGNTNALIVKIGNGTNLSISITANNALPTNTLLRIRVKRTGLTVTAYVNDVQVGTQTATNAFTSGNAVNAMTMGAGGPQYLKDILLFDRNVTAGELTQIQSRTFSSITPTPINVDLIWGDSNASGFSLNATLPAPVTSGAIDTLIMKMATTAISRVDYIERLQIARNQMILNVSNLLTAHGGEMRLGYNFSSSPYGRAILKYGEGSTDAAGWTSPNTQYTRWLNMIPIFVDDLFHIYRRTPVVRSMIQWHGANDVQIGDGANYESAVIALVKATIDTFNALPAFQIPVVKMRQVVFRYKSGTGISPNATAQGLVRTAQENLGGSAFLTAHPSYSTYYLGSTWFDTDSEAAADGTHYTTYETMSGQAYSYLLPFINE